MYKKDIKEINAVVLEERDCGHIFCDFDDRDNDLREIAALLGVEAYDEDDLLDMLQTEFDNANLGATIWSNDTCNYIECVKSIKPVKIVLEKLGLKIKKEYTSNGSDYDSYIIELEDLSGANFKNTKDKLRVEEALEYYYSLH